ncbi:permease [Gorillibacterium sp. sgz5001074]|uniref:permease n=1 Tax=Gorillibacterium sp. sgz5001074 TaxID=3446695 RepID=UPI003F663C69
MTLSELASFKTMFIGILLEAVPFLLLGVFVSSVLQIAVTEERLRKLLPRSPLLGLLAAASAGILLPVCECGMIPVVRRLIRKGMPPSMGVTYLLAAPVLNPVVFLATSYAFRGRPGYLYPRMGLALAVALAAGLAVHLFCHRQPLKHRTDSFSDQQESAGNPRGWIGWLEHMLGEFFEMGKYLLFGITIASAIQTFVSRAALLELGQHSWTAYPFMMGLAYVLSLCSTSDAFVAASFYGTFGQGPLLAFMVMGPMLDLKSTLMLFSSFRFRFVVGLMALIVVLVWFGSALAAGLG